MLNTLFAICGDRNTDLKYRYLDYGATHPIKLRHARKGRRDKIRWFVL